MESLEVSAKTVDEAIQLALQRLGLGLEQVEVTVIKKGRTGILGLGGEEARISVKPLVQEQPPAEAPEEVPAEAKATDVAPLAQKVLEDLLSAMLVSAAVEEAEAPSGSNQVITLNIKGDDLGVLIGRRGQTLASLQYVVNLIVTHRLKSRLSIPVSLDVNDYKQRRYQSLQSLALRMAEQVRATGRTVSLEPMPANERRIVHLALAESDDVLTQSIGEGEARKVAIMPKSKKAR